MAVPESIFTKRGIKITSPPCIQCKAGKTHCIKPATDSRITIFDLTATARLQSAHEVQTASAELSVFHSFLL